MPRLAALLLLALLGLAAEARAQAVIYVVRAVAHAVSGAERGGTVATARLTLLR